MFARLRMFLVYNILGHFITKREWLTFMKEKGLTSEIYQRWLDSNEEK